MTSTRTWGRRTYPFWYLSVRDFSPLVMAFVYVRKVCCHHAAFTAGILRTGKGKGQRRTGLIAQGHRQTRRTSASAAAYPPRHPGLSNARPPLANAKATPR